MNDKDTQILEEIIIALHSKGYDPHEQLYGYVKTGNDLYITRKNNAREKIKLIDILKLKEYLEHKNNI